MTVPEGLALKLLVRMIDLGGSFLSSLSFSSKVSMSAFLSRLHLYRVEVGMSNLALTSAGVWVSAYSRTVLLISVSSGESWVSGGAFCLLAQPNTVEWGIWNNLAASVTVWS